MNVELAIVPGRQPNNVVSTNVFETEAGIVLHEVGCFVQRPLALAQVEFEGLSLSSHGRRSLMLHERGG
jgi:hypothetical protein